MTERLERAGTTRIGEHPEAIATAAYLDGTLPQPARDALEAHLAACDACRAGVALLRLRDEREGSAAEAPADMLRRVRELGAASSATARATPAPESPSRARSRFRLALPASLAAGLVAAAGLALWMRAASGPGAPGPGTPVERQGAGAAIEALSPARGEAVEAPRLDFRWSPVDGADRYVVSVLDASGAEIATLEAAPPGDHASWPADRPLPAAGTYLWSVRALVLDRVLAETRPVPFEIR